LWDVAGDAGDAAAAGKEEEYSSSKICIAQL
jgi:hypothetical protein